MQRRRLAIFSLCLALLPIAAPATTPDFANIPIVLEDETHSIFFYDKGWFSETRYAVKYFNAAWHWHSQSGWAGLNTPFVGKWNPNYRIILDRGGKIFLNSNDSRSQMEIQWRNGEWEWKNADGDEWTSIQADTFEEEMYRHGNG